MVAPLVGGIFRMAGRDETGQQDGGENDFGSHALMPRLYAGTDGCKVKNSAARVSFDARHVFAPAKMVKKV
jgi:hypothetical protein